MISPREHVLQPFLDKAAEEEKRLGAPARGTLFVVARVLVRCAPNLYTGVWLYPTYSLEEKDAAVKLLKRYGLERFCNLSPKFKRVTLDSIESELDKEEGCIGLC